MTYAPWNRPALLRLYSVPDTTTRWGYPVSDARSNCVLLPSRCPTLKHAIPKQQSWFLDGGPTCIVHNMASLSMSCVQHCCAGDPFPTLPHSEAILYLTHGRNVYCYHVDVPPSCLLYTRTLHGFWKFAPYAFSLTWLPYCSTTSTIAEQVRSTQHYHTRGPSNVCHTVNMCSSTI